MKLFLCHSSKDADIVTWKRFLAGAAMCALVMAVGRLGIESAALKLLLQISSGAVFYVAVLYLAKDAMLKEMLTLATNRIRCFLHV